jgi:hypothetical protein
VSVREVSSLRALLCRRVRTIAHRIRACVGLPSLGLVPLRSYLRAGLLRPDATNALHSLVPDPTAPWRCVGCSRRSLAETHSVPCPASARSRPGRAPDRAGRREDQLDAHPARLSPHAMRRVDRIRWPSLSLWYLRGLPSSPLPMVRGLPPRAAPFRASSVTATAR